MKFFLIYSDLSTVSGETQADWQSAPNQGVQFVIEYDKTRLKEPLRVITGYDYYYFLIDATGQPYIWGCNDEKPQLAYLQEPYDVVEKERFYQLGFKNSKKDGLTISDIQYEVCRGVAKSVADKLGG